MKLNIELSTNNTHIGNSYLIRTRKSMESKIKDILEERKAKGYLITRSVKSYIREWKGHNRLYYMHLFRNHTKDVDLEENIPLWKEIIWMILSL